MTTELQSVNTTYEPFSYIPEYIEVNKRFVGGLDLAGVRHFLDVACGTGTVSRLLLAAVPGAHLNGVDLDPVQIELSTAEFRKEGYEVRHSFELTEDTANGKPVVVLGVTPGEQLPFPDGAFDCATIANAIHMIPDKPAFVRAVHRVCRPGALFAFNSSFYAGSYPPGTENHITYWIREATLFIDRLNKERKEQGKEPYKRVRGTTRAAFQNRWFSPEDWKALLTEVGFTVQSNREETVQLSTEAVAAIGAYGGMAQVLLSGYPVEVGSLALKETAQASLDALKLPTLPRNWLTMTARKN